VRWHWQNLTGIQIQFEDILIQTENPIESKYEKLQKGIEKDFLIQENLYS